MLFKLMKMVDVLCRRAEVVGGINTGYAQHNQCRVDADYHSVILVDSLHHGIA